MAINSKLFIYLILKNVTLKCFVILQIKTPQRQRSIHNINGLAHNNQGIFFTVKSGRLYNSG